MMALWDEAEKIYFLGVEVYAFGLYCALGAAAALIVLLLQCKRAGLPKGAAALAGALGLVCAFLCSRLLFCLMDQSMGLEGLMPFSAMAMVTGGGYSMIGVLAGGILGGMLAGKILGLKPLAMGEMMIPALLLFAACERLGEGYMPDFGVSRPLLGELLKGTFLAVEGEYDWYLATYLLESFAALILALVMLRDVASQHKRGKIGQALLLFGILYGGVQTVMESLRYDRHLSISFVGLQHVLAIAMLGLSVIYLAILRRKDMKKMAVAALISVPMVVILGLLLEFAIDRTTVSRYLLYLVYILLVSVPMYLGVRLRKGVKEDGKASD